MERKGKQSDAQRETEIRRERVSLFFINRPIKQERPPSMFYFVQAPFPRFCSRARFFRISFSLSYRPAFASLFRILSFSSLAVANLRARVLVLLADFLFPSLSRFPARISSSRGGAPPFSTAPGAVLFFCYFIQLFRERTGEREKERGILLLPGRATPVFSGQ